MKISYFSNIKNQLGESPLWDPRYDLLWWVDIVKKQLFAATEDGSVVNNWEFSEPVCSIGLATGGLIAAFASGFALINLDGTVKKLPGPSLTLPGIRFNDGKADRYGRFLSGTMRTSDEVEGLGTLWRLDNDGRVEKIEEGFRLSNATCFSPDGKTLYFADTLERIIRRYPYDPITGSLGPREDFINTAYMKSAPDGATVDSEGYLWVALVETQTVARFNPSGKLDRLIEVPIPFPSCPAFGGKDLNKLYVTTIADSGHRLSTDHPDGGRILEISDLGVHGLAEGIFDLKYHI